MIEMQKSDFFETGKEGVRKILTPDDKKNVYVTAVKQTEDGKPEFIQEENAKWVENAAKWAEKLD